VTSVINNPFQLGSIIQESLKFYYVNFMAVISAYNVAPTILEKIGSVQQQIVNNIVRLKFLPKILPI